ncbi:MAG: cytochrome c biogenesis protein ResB, partial [bacterium]|nr:cytochrome c biogenesis protein ResB [bacterium]
MNPEDYTTEPQSNGKPTKKKGLWATLSSMKFAIWTLILLGALSLIALFVGELRDPEAAQGTGAGRALMQLLQMDDPFRSWWYRLLLGVLCLSLFTCVIERFPVIWRRWSKTPSDDISWLKNARHGIVRVVNVAPEELQFLFRGWSWRIKNDTLWLGERGRLGIWGPILTHLGMLLIGVGALVGSFGGFRAREGGFAGDVVRLAHADFSVRIDSFRVIYYPLQPGQWVLVEDEWIGRLGKQNPDGTWPVREVWRDGEGEPVAVPAENIR